MAVQVTNKNGKTVTLLNPAEKGRKYAAELKAGKKCTNDHKIKRMPDGSVMGLDNVERAYRSGYLDARKDSANCWKAQQKKVNEKKSARKRKSK